MQPVEYRKDSLDNEKIIAWSLGNLISNQTKVHTDGGSALQFSLYRDSTGEVKIKNIGYHLHWVWIHNVNNKKRYQILPISKLEKMKIEMNENDQNSMKIFIENERTLYQEHNINVPEYQYDIESNSYFLPFKINTKTLG